MRRKSVISTVREMVHRFQLAAQELVISLFEKALGSCWLIYRVSDEVECFTCCLVLLLQEHSLWILLIEGGCQRRHGMGVMGAGVLINAHTDHLGYVFFSHQVFMGRYGDCMLRRPVSELRYSLVKIVSTRNLTVTSCPIHRISCLPSSMSLDRFLPQRFQLIMELDLHQLLVLSSLRCCLYLTIINALHLTVDAQEFSQTKIMTNCSIID